MSVHTTTDQVKKLIIEHFPLARKRALKEEDQLLEEGILDSLGVLELVSYLEEAFDISVCDEELIPEHFQTVGRLTAFIQNKAAGNSRVLP